VALGTPVVAATAYSAQNGTSVAPAYPSGILATDEVLLFVGQKPSTANGGTVTTPTGWTLQDSLTGAGGYGTTLGADTGNTNLRVYSWDTPVAGQTGTRSVTLSQNNVAWAFIVRIPTGGGAISYGSADGQRTTTPTSPMSIALTNGATATNFQSGDLAIWAMCIPTDVSTPSQFSAQSVTATGATFATATELNEPDSQTGSDIGGYSAYAHVNSGSSTTAPTVTVTVGGTRTNVRGPVVLLRVREAPVTQTLTPSKYDNTQTFYNPTVSIEQFLTPALYTNDQTFYSAAITQSGGAQTLSPSLYTNDQTFFSPTAAASYTLTPARYDNGQTFFPPTVAATRALTPARYDNNQTFYSPTVAATYTLTPALYSNQHTFYAPAVTTTVTLAPNLYSNEQAFFSPTVAAGAVNLSPDLYTNTPSFFSPVVSAGATLLAPDLYTNGQTFYSPTVAAGAVTLAPDLYSNGQSFFSPVVSAGGASIAPDLYTNQSVFYSATVVVGSVTVAPDLYTNAQTFFSPVVSSGAASVAPGLFTNAQTFYAPAVTTSRNLVAELFSNGSTFFAPTVALGAVAIAPPLVTNTSEFFSPTVSSDATVVAPELHTNASTIFSPTAQATYQISFDEYVESGYVDPGYVSPVEFNSQRFFRPTLTQTAAVLRPERYTNQSTFYAPTVSGGDTYQWDTSQGNAGKFNQQHYNLLVRDDALVADLIVTLVTQGFFDGHAQSMFGSR
jgi:hypothetical protein